jgi:signal peptidase I
MVERDPALGADASGASSAESPGGWVVGPTWPVDGYRGSRTDDDRTADRPVAGVGDAVVEAADRGEQVFIDAWDAWAQQTAPVAPRRRSALLLVREAVETAVLALAIFLAVRAVVQNFRVEGSSMDPTYATGQYVLVNKLLYQRVNLAPVARLLPFVHLDSAERYLFRGPRRGEVVVFHPPLPSVLGSGERDFIKRVIGLPGEHVLIRDGRVYIDGQELVEPYLRSAQTHCGGQWCDVVLGPDEYFVMGDNRGNSSDSRLWGPVRGDKIIGKAWFVYLPFDDFGPAPNQQPVLAGEATPNAAPARGGDGPR